MTLDDNHAAIVEVDLESQTDHLEPGGTDESDMAKEPRWKNSKQGESGQTNRGGSVVNANANIGQRQHQRPAFKFIPIKLLS